MNDEDIYLHVAVVHSVQTSIKSFAISDSFKS
jgi:hypothetical protein